MSRGVAVLPRRMEENFQKHQILSGTACFQTHFYISQTAAHLYLYAELEGKHKNSLRWLVDFESVFSSNERTMLEIIMFSIYILMKWQQLIRSHNETVSHAENSGNAGKQIH